MRKSIIPVFIPHLGCPHDCVFCNQKRISGSLLPACPDDVVKAVEEALPKCQNAELAFYGGSFTAIAKDEQCALLDAAAPYIGDGRICSIRVSARPDAINDDILSLLWEKGVRTIELGSQSMVNSVLSASWRGHTAEDTEKAAKMIKDRGFFLVLQMMTGLPGSDMGKDILSAEKIAAVKPDAVRIYPTVIIRDTVLADMWREGEYEEHSVEAAAEVCAEILPIFERAGIPVIRLGLNPSDELSGGDALGGAYHPALGEIVKSRVLLKKARELLRGVKAGESVILRVNSSCLSQMIGQKRSNIIALTKEFSLEKLTVKSADVEIGEILVDFVAKEDIL
ncbi:MAG: radical SAM protein [Ruminococcaceae bacterium]|nr:radical SAM protein [Oscillospiraceae bacterium]